jgi:sugar/nucleoside kinase (ribokinase family)
MVALARLGLRARYIGKIGNDQIGRYQLESITSEGVDASGVMIVEGAESQLAFIIVDQASGEPGEVDRDLVTSGRALLLDGHNVEASIVAAGYARDAGIPTVLDIDNIYPGAERLLPLIDFLISSSTFPRRMTGESDVRFALKELSKQTGSLLVAATLGVEGVLAYIRGEYIHSPAFVVDCVDTTGAGDAFHGGFIYGLLAGFSIEDTLRFSNAVAALKCRQVGARTALPNLDDVNALLASAR